MNNTFLKKKRILVLTANPRNTDRLRLDEEVRDIKEGLRLAVKRDQFEVVSEWAVRPKDFSRALDRYRPQIVHFSGHGTGSQGLVLEADSGMQLASTEALSGLFEIFKKDGIECVVLNACYSEVQAEAIHKHIDCVVGMSQAIGDTTAIDFAVGFYDALGAGRSYEEAYKLGCNAIAFTKGISESSVPVLKLRPKKTGGNEIPSIPPGVHSVINELQTTARGPLGLFWLLWVLATVVGGFIGIYASVKGQEVGAGAQIVGRIIGGAALGLGQWLVLRTQGLRSIWWIPVTVMGWLLGWAIGGGFVWKAVEKATDASSYFDHISNQDLGAILINFAVGIAAIQIFTGLAQWLLLRSQISEAKWWILATLLSAALTIPVTSFVGWIFAWVVGWLVFGIATGAALVWRLQRS